MAYTTKNYPTKKALKADLAEGKPVRAFNRCGYTQADKPEWQEHTCKVYRDTVWDEWRVILLVNTHKVEGADYQTDDMDDALNTARNMALSGLSKDDTLKSFNYSANKSIHHHILNWDK